MNKMNTFGSPVHRMHTTRFSGSQLTNIYLIILPILRGRKTYHLIWERCYWYA